MGKTSKNAVLSSDRTREVRRELADKIASFIGAKERLITEVPGPPSEPQDRSHRADLRDL